MFLRKELIGNSFLLTPAITFYFVKFECLKSGSSSLLDLLKIKVSLHVKLSYVFQGKYFKKKFLWFTFQEIDFMVFLKKV